MKLAMSVVRPRKGTLFPEWEKIPLAWPMYSACPTAPCSVRTSSNGVAPSAKTPKELPDHHSPAASQSV